MSIGDPFTATIPSVGALGTDYASDLNDLLEEIVDRLDVAVPVGSIAPADSALDMNNQAVQSASYVSFYEQADAPSGAPFGRLVYHGSEMYAVTPGGVVKITDSGGLNLAATGGFGGDYGTGPESANFVNATETYEFYDDAAATQWALLKARGIDIIDETAGFRTRLTSSTGIAADQAYVLPPADPASGVSVLTINSSGQILLAENSAPTNVYTSVLPYHGDLEVAFAPSSTDWWSIVGTPARSTATGVITSTADHTTRIACPPVPVGRRLKGMKATVANPGAGTTCTLNVYPVTLGSAGASIGTGSTGSAGNIEVAVSTTATTVTDEKHFFLEIAFSGGAAAARSILTCTFTYDHVA